MGEFIVSTFGSAGDASEGVAAVSAAVVGVAVAGGADGARVWTIGAEG